MNTNNIKIQQKHFSFSNTELIAYSMNNNFLKRILGMTLLTGLW
jgi:hypothetical protein